MCTFRCASHWPCRQTVKRPHDVKQNGKQTYLALFGALLFLSSRKAPVVFRIGLCRLCVSARSKIDRVHCRFRRHRFGFCQSSLLTLFAFLTCSLSVNDTSTRGSAYTDQQAQRCPIRRPDQHRQRQRQHLLQLRHQQHPLQQASHPRLPPRGSFSSIGMLAASETPSL